MYVLNSINVFLDSNQLYRDPFFENIHSKILLQSAEEKKCNVYMSTVVVEEIINNYLKEVMKLSEDLIRLKNRNKNISQSVQLEINHNIDNDKLRKKIVDFYGDLSEKGLIRIVNYNNNILPTLVNRSIYRKKPFTDKKQEFRDAIIWLSYVKIALDENLENCYFVTNNTEDYTENGKIHKDLLEDSKKFELLNSFKSLNDTLDAIPSEDEYLQNLLQDNSSKNYYNNSLEKLRSIFMIGEEIDGSTLEHENLLSELYYRSTNAVEDERSVGEGLIAKVESLEMSNLKILNLNFTESKDILINGVIQLENHTVFKEKKNALINFKDIKDIYAKTSIPLTMQFFAQLTQDFDIDFFDFGEMDFGYFDD